MPSAFARENRNKVPAVALWVTNIVVQLFVISPIGRAMRSTLMLNLTSAMTLIPFLLVAAYGLQLAQRGETYEARPDERRARPDLSPAIATIYTIFLIYAGGLKFVLLSAILLRARDGALLLGAARAGQAGFHAGLDWVHLRPRRRRRAPSASTGSRPATSRSEPGRSAWLGPEVTGHSASIPRSASCAR